MLTHRQGNILRFRIPRKEPGLQRPEVRADWLLIGSRLAKQRCRAFSSRQWNCRDESICTVPAIPVRVRVR
jgi:hypothetical protein